MKRIWLALVVTTMTACTSVGIRGPDSTTDPAAPDTVAPSTSASVETTSTVAPATTVAGRPVPVFETAPCGANPTVAFSVLCEAVEDVLALHVDEPDREALARAAMLGLASVGPNASGETVDDFTCYLPAGAADASTDPFVGLCQAIARESGDVAAPLTDFVKAATESMFDYGLDPFSAYVPGDIFESGFDDSGLVYSLGMVVSPRNEAGGACAPVGGICRLEIISVFDFSAASKAGVAPRDLITSIDGVGVEGLSGAEAVALLEGAPGTSVEVQVDRRGSELTRMLVREDLRFVPTEWDFFDGGIAYFRMNDFSQQAAIDLGAFLGSDEVAASSSLILDLRDNPGGLVLAAQAVASQFLDGGLVLVERGRDSSEELPVVVGGLATDRLRLVVLVNRASASASEIVAAVLQERGRATVIGEPTFGKNLVQWVTETRDGGQMRITVARWETPGGLDIGIRGLAPDIEVEADPQTEQDEVLEAAIATLR